MEIVRRLGRKLTAGETENMNSCVEDLKDIAKKFEQLVENGIKELNNSALKHEVKPLIDEFRGIKTRSYRFSNIVGKISFDPAFLARVK